MSLPGNPLKFDLINGRFVWIDTGTGEIVEQCKPRQEGRRTSAVNGDTGNPGSFPEFARLLNTGHVNRQTVNLRKACPDCGLDFPWCECPECNQVPLASADYRSITNLDYVEGIGWARVRDDGSVMRRAYCQNDRDNVVSLYRDRVPPSRIAEQTGVPVNTVKSWIQRHGRGAVA